MLSTWVSMSLSKLPSNFLSGTMLHCHTVLLVLHNSYKQPLSALEEITCHTVTHNILYTQPNHIIFWQLQQPHIFHLHSPCHQDMLLPLLFPLHHITFLPDPLPLQYSLHIFCMYKFSQTLESPFLLWHIYHISTYHIVHNTELTFTLKLQTPYGSTSLVDKPSFVTPLLTITMVFSRLTFKPLLSKSSFQFQNSYLNPLIDSLIMTKLSAYSKFT